jgi:hypothetical protein
MFFNAGLLKYAVNSWDRFERRELAAQRMAP